MDEVVPKGDDSRGLRDLLPHLREELEHLADGFTHDFELPLDSRASLQVAAYSGRVIPEVNSAMS